jgi:hypothetical protein
MVPAAYLIDLFWVEPRDKHGGLEPVRIRNELDYPALLLLRDRNREYIIEVHAIIGAVDTYCGLGEYARRVRRQMGRGGGAVDAVIAAHGMYPFRV